MENNYSKFHSNRLNLVIHLIFVPVFVVAFALSVLNLAQGNLAASGWLFVVALLAFASQAIGHGRESVPPEPFTGVGDFLQRIFAEQFFKFWRFLFFGNFGRAWRNIQL